MAFGQALNADDEQKQQAAQQSFVPPSIGGGGSGGFSAGGAAPAAQQPVSGSGTGFTNLQSYLDNNDSDRAGGITKASGTALGAEGKRFDDATKDIRDATGSVGATPTSTSIATAFHAASGNGSPTTVSTAANAPVRTESPTGPIQIGTGGEGGTFGLSINKGYMKGRGVTQAPATQIETPQMTATQGYDALEHWLNDGYDGPMNVDYSPTAENAGKLQQLSSAKTALQGAAGDKIAKQPYSLGNEMMDQALYQGDANVHAATNKTGKDVEAFDEKTGKDVADLEGKAQKAVDDTRTTREMTRAALGRYAEGIGGGIDARAKSRSDQEAEDRQNGIIRDPNTGQVTSVPTGQMKGAWEEGTGATRANTANDTERAQYSQLAKLLGIDDIGAKSDYNSGRYVTQADPNQIGRLGEHQMTDDQYHIYRNYLDSGFTEEQARDAAMSMQERGAEIWNPAVPPPAAAPAPTNGNNSRNGMNYTSGRR